MTTNWTCQVCGRTVTGTQYRARADWLGRETKVWHVDCYPKPIQYPSPSQIIKRGLTPAHIGGPLWVHEGGGEFRTLDSGGYGEVGRG